MIVMINISPSLINKLYNSCPKAIYFEKIEKIKTEPTELMIKGRLFEHQLLGATVDGEVPELPKLKNGGKSADEKALDELVEFAKEVFAANNIDLKNDVQTQVRLEHEGMSGVIDWIGKDFQNSERLAIYDLKYTETREDDRWNGWADIENKPDAKFQAVHYVRLAYEKFKTWMPYYFVIFGKSKWAKIIKVLVSEQSITAHEFALNAAKEKIKKLEESGWKATPSLDKCGKCPFANICNEKSMAINVEVVQL